MTRNGGIYISAIVLKDFMSMRNKYPNLRGHHYRHDNRFMIVRNEMILTQANFH